ncbi:type II toxin-antitoxin system RelE/ParE family toxin [Duganella sp. P38]|uniref:type II toxin-antitoxin system RelE/ParE family toxin n=1 Tax=Duganella sp. P38 TaxID=3423949 RepID=UPI003D7BEF8A
MHTIVELADFTRLWPRYWLEEDYNEFIGYLAANPFAGVVIPNTGGVRKVRWGKKGSGKSGGVRVIYFTRNALGEIILITIYAKSVTANLTPANLKDLRHDYEKISAVKR